MRLVQVEHAEGNPFFSGATLYADVDNHTDRDQQQAENNEDGDEHKDDKSLIGFFYGRNRREDIEKYEHGQGNQGDNGSDVRDKVMIGIRQTKFHFLPFLE